MGPRRGTGAAAVGHHSRSGGVSAAAAGCRLGEMVVSTGRTAAGGAVTSTRAAAGCRSIFNIRADDSLGPGRTRHLPGPAARHPDPVVMTVDRRAPEPAPEVRPHPQRPRRRARVHSRTTPAKNPDADSPGKASPLRRVGGGHLGIQRPGERGRQWRPGRGGFRGCGDGERSDQCPPGRRGCLAGAAVGGCARRGCPRTGWVGFVERRLTRRPVAGKQKTPGLW